MQETNSAKKPVRIAIADDHMMFRMGLAALLRNAEGRFEIVAEAGDGQELINMLAKLETPPQVCLVDVNMPVLDGYKTLAYLRMKYRDMKFLTLSMYDHEFAIIKMLRQGANGYLLKEDDPEVLMNAIEHVVDNDFYHSDLTNAHLKELIGEEAHKRLELNANEKMFLELCCTEMIYKEIATAMGLSVRTIEGYRDDLFQKVGVNTRTGLVIYAMKHGLVNL